MIAVEEGDFELSKMLLEGKADINAVRTVKSRADKVLQP